MKRSSEIASAINKNAILTLLREKGPMSKADLARALGLSFPAVSYNVGRLLEEKRICELGAADNALGRKGTLLAFNARFSYLAGADIGRDRIRVMCADMGGEILSFRQRQIRQGEDVVRQAARKIRPEEGIFLEYAPIDRDSAFALDDPSCWKNVCQTAPLRELLEVFGTKDAQVLEYWMDNSRFYGWRHPFGELPFYQGVLRRDAAFYASRGFESVTSFGCGLNAAYARDYGEAPMLEYGRILKELP